MNTHTNHYRTVFRRIILIAVMLAAFGTASGCIYRINIQQGNLLEADLIDQVEVGMTKAQVRFLLGTPLVKNPFDDDRWDYYYYFKAGKSRKTTKQHYIVFFTDDQVSSVAKPSQELGAKDLKS